MTASREDVRKKEWRDRAELAVRSGPIPLRCEICGVPAARPCINSITLAKRDRPHITRVLAAGGTIPDAPQLQEAPKP